MLRQLRAERDTQRAAPWPPVGCVDRYAAAGRLGVTVNTINLWFRHGRLGYNGRLEVGPNGVECRVYDVAALDRAVAAMHTADAAPVPLPTGCVGKTTAAAVLGIAPLTLDGWDRAGRALGGSWQKTRPGKKRRVFALTALEAENTRRAAEASRPTAPEGFIELHAAAERLGVNIGTMADWEKAGRLPVGETVPVPGTSARTKVYLTEDVERLAAALAAAPANFPPPGWVTLEEAAARANVSAGVWKKWTQCGRADKGKWVTRPLRTGGGQCKLYRLNDVDRVVAEAGRDHDFFLEVGDDGRLRMPAGYVGRAGAAAMLGATETAFVRWQTEGWIAVGRWARAPVGRRSPGRRAYSVAALQGIIAAFEARGGARVDPDDPTVVRVLSPDGVARDAIIDAADLPAVAGQRWYWSIGQGKDAGPDKGCVATRTTDGRQEALRLLERMGEGEAKKHRSRTAHVNGDRLDFRRANLIVKEGDEHIHGGRKRRLTHFGRPPTSRFKGVSWAKKEERWKAHIQKDGVGRRLGSFHDEVAAAEAYDKAARELYGELAFQNFPREFEVPMRRKAA